MQSGKKEKSCACLGLGLATEQRERKQKPDSVADLWPIEIREFWEEAVNVICSNQFSFNKGTEMVGKDMCFKH